MINNKEIEYVIDDEDYTFTIDYGRIYEYIENKFADNYGLRKSVAKEIIEDLSLYEQLEEEYEDDIYDDFEVEAREQYEDSKEYKDKYSYYGVDRNGF